MIAARRPSSETNGLLGRVYKDRWEKAVQAEEVYAARLLLKQAIKTYLAGFEAHWRDAYLGINAVTLMEIDDDPRRHALIPVARYAAERRLARKGQADYWEHATRLELAILANDALSDALANVRVKWELEPTARNLRLIAETRVARGADAGGIETVLGELGKRAASMGSRKSAPSIKVRGVDAIK